MSEVEMSTGVQADAAESVTKDNKERPDLKKSNARRHNDNQENSHTKTIESDGDEAESWVDRYGEILYRFAMMRVKDPVIAEDLVQETFIEVMRSIAKFRGEAALGSWIRRIAISKALMFLRSAWTARSQSLGDDWNEVTPGDAASHGISRHPDEALDLDAALANLPSVARAVVWLHDVEGFTHKEIAGLMGRTESFSKSQLSRAYQRLRPMLTVPDEEARAESAALRSV